MEKKTFKNPYALEASYPESHIVIYDVSGNLFSSLEWDMEVTFIKKQHEIAIGDIVTDGCYDMRVVAIEDDRAWCYNFANPGGGAENFYSTEWLRDLKHADS